MNKHPVQEGVAILLGMLHAKETGISFDRLGLWLVCAFILTYFISWYMLLISAVVKTNIMQDITLDAQILVHRNYVCPFFCRIMSSN